MEIGWERYGDGTFEIRALPPPDAVRVEFLVDGYRVGEAGPASGTAFAITYRFHGEGTGRQVEARATNAGGRVIARGYGSLDVVGGATAVFIRQIAARTYEIGLERPPAEVAAIEVRADGHLLTDELSGESRATRLAVQSGFYTLGSRAFEVSTFNFDGSWRGTLRRSFTLR
jgi:hypothetical protein